MKKQSTTRLSPIYQLGVFLLSCMLFFSCDSGTDFIPVESNDITLRVIGRYTIESISFQNMKLANLPSSTHSARLSIGRRSDSSINLTVSVWENNVRTDYPIDDVAVYESTDGKSFDFIQETKIVGHYSGNALEMKNLIGRGKISFNFTGFR
jgi:hypothetical protein